MFGHLKNEKQILLYFKRVEALLLKDLKIIVFTAGNSTITSNHRKYFFHIQNFVLQ